MTTAETWTPVEPLPDDEPQGATFWEPWQPTTGTRVVVRDRGECPVANMGDIDGVWGTVIFIDRDDPELRANGHYYGIQAPDLPLFWCSATEIEPMRVP